MAIDPVHKMKVDAEKSAGKEIFAGQKYYFRSDTCHKEFIAEPEKYTSNTTPPDHSYCGGRKSLLLLTNKFFTTRHAVLSSNESNKGEHP